jgi:transposase
MGLQPTGLIRGPRTGSAPINRGSGSGSRGGQRAIAGGRAGGRNVLCLATLGAVRGNPAIKAFCARLRDNRKPGKLAIAAGLRKLATIFNAMVRDRLAAAAA